MDTIKRWEKIAEDQLCGRKIVKVRYLNDEEMDMLGWYRKSLVVFLDNGSYFFPSSDDEGNHPGALFTSDKNEPTIPVI